MSRRRTSSDLSARARQLASRAGIPYSAALTSLRTPSAEGPGVPGSAAATGLPTLDRLLPLMPGTLTVLAGRTTAGTTALLLGIALHHGHCGQPVILSSRQSRPRTTTRNLLAAEAGQDLDQMTGHVLDRPIVAEAAARMRGLPIRLLAPDASNAISRLRAEAKAGGAGLLLVDSLLLAAGLESCPPQPGRCAAQLVSLARELDVPAVATSHLRPRLGDDDGDRPRLDRLDDPGVLEHAHQFVLLHRPAPTGRRDLVTLHVVRPDGTPAGTTTVLFEPEYHRMVPVPRA